MIYDNLIGITEEGREQWDRRRGQDAGSQASRQTNRWTDTINVQSSEAQSTGQTKRIDRVLAGRQASRQTIRWTDTINVQSCEAQREGQTKRTDRVQASKQTDKQVGRHDKCAIRRSTEKGKDE